MSQQLGTRLSSLTQSQESPARQVPVVPASSNSSESSFFSLLPEPLHSSHGTRDTNKKNHPRPLQAAQTEESSRGFLINIFFGLRRIETLKFHHAWRISMLVRQIERTENASLVTVNWSARKPRSEVTYLRDARLHHDMGREIGCNRVYGRETDQDIAP